MREVSVIGLDPCEEFISTPWRNSEGAVVFHKGLSRVQVLKFLAAQADA
jgi:hypothetical protein